MTGPQDMPPMPSGDDTEQPGVIPLRPLVLGELYSAAKGVVVRNWALLLGIAFAVNAVEQLLSLGVRLGLEDNLDSMLADRSFSSGDFVRAVISGGIASLLIAAISFVLGLAVTAVAAIIVGTVSTPVTVCVTTLLYFDYRMRREGPRSILAG